MEVFSRENPVFASFSFYAMVLILKMFFVQLFTSFRRITRNVFRNPEDLNFAPKGTKVIIDDPEVERARRAHQNDIENIFPFLLIGFFYLTTLPALSTALVMFRVFTAARISHSFVYLFKIPQPTRGLSFAVGLVINTTMAIQILMFYMS